MYHIHQLLRSAVCGREGTAHQLSSNIADCSIHVYTVLLRVCTQHLFDARLLLPIGCALVACAARALDLGVYHLNVPGLDTGAAATFFPAKLRVGVCFCAQAGLQRQVKVNTAPQCIVYSTLKLCQVWQQHRNRVST